jgi:serine protease Do
MGLSFAIPIDVAMDVQAQLKASGKVSRGRIGVAIQEVTKELADSFGLAKPEGALVATVEKGGPGDKGGIEAGDVILKFDGKTVDHSADLPRLVGAAKPGSRANVQVWRQGATKDLSVAVGEWQDDKPALAGHGGRHGKEAGPAANRLGLVLAEPSSEQRADMGITSGLVVEDTKAAGGRLDVRPGDVILSVTSKGVRTEAKSVDQFNGLLAKMDEAATFTLLVRRGDTQTFVTVKGFDGK